MDNSMIAKTLNKYYDILKVGEPTQEEENYVYNIEFDLAKNIIEDFGEESAVKIAKLILASKNVRTEYANNLVEPTAHCYSPMYLDSNGIHNKYAIYCNK